MKDEEQEKGDDEACSRDESFAINGKEYWARVPATVDGMLGGFSFVSSADIIASRRFITPFLHGKKARTGHAIALDCGSGIGRVSKHLLTLLFDKVDMLDQNSAFLEEARTYLGDQLPKIENFLCSGLQNFSPESERYDVIWVQWVLSHIPDDGINKFLLSCKSGLKKTGMLFVKENLSGSGEVERDEVDFTITRPGYVIREFIRKAGFIISKEMKQPKFPSSLYEVRMFACRLPD